jgi:hypothetical protein
MWQQSPARPYCLQAQPNHNVSVAAAILVMVRRITVMSPPRTMGMQLRPITHMPPRRTTDMMMMEVGMAPTEVGTDMAAQQSVYAAAITGTAPELA